MGALGPRALGSLGARRTVFAARPGPHRGCGPQGTAAALPGSIAVAAAAAAAPTGDMCLLHQRAAPCAPPTPAACKFINLPDVTDPTNQFTSTDASVDAVMSTIFQGEGA